MRERHEHAVSQVRVQRFGAISAYTIVRIPPPRPKHQGMSRHIASEAVYHTYRTSFRCVLIPTRRTADDDFWSIHERAQFCARFALNLASDTSLGGESVRLGFNNPRCSRTIWAFWMSIRIGLCLGLCPASGYSPALRAAQQSIKQAKRLPSFGCTMSFGALFCGLDLWFVHASCTWRLACFAPFAPVEHFGQIPFMPTCPAYVSCIFSFRRNRHFDALFGQIRRFAKTGLVRAGKHRNVSGMWAWWGHASGFGLALERHMGGTRARRRPSGA